DLVDGRLVELRRPQLPPQRRGEREHLRRGHRGADGGDVPGGPGAERGDQAAAVAAEAAIFEGEGVGVGGVQAAVVNGLSAVSSRLSGEPRAESVYLRIQSVCTNGASATSFR